MANGNWQGQIFEILRISLLNFAVAQYMIEYDEHLQNIYIISYSPGVAATNEHLKMSISEENLKRDQTFLWFLV